MRPHSPRAMSPNRDRSRSRRYSNGSAISQTAPHVKGWSTLGKTSVSASAAQPSQQGSAAQPYDERVEDDEGRIPGEDVEPGGDGWDVEPEQDQGRGKRRDRRAEREPGVV